MLRTVILVIMLVITNHSYTQEDAWVYLSDKPNITEALASPISILTQKAIDRKKRHGIAIDARDVPVNEAYISDLKTQTGITVLAKSKWFNAVYVRAVSAENINNLLELSYVEIIDFADNSLDATSSRPTNFEDKNDIESESIDFTYGTAQNQIEMINVDNLHASDFTGKGITIAV